MTTIHAVIWQDAKLGGIPLTLTTPTAQAAIDLAQSMHSKAMDTLCNLRAVSIAPDADAFETLWKPV